MNLIEIPEAGVVAHIPASYSEMTRPQVHYVIKQLCALQRKEISLPEFRVRVLYHLAGIKRSLSSITWERMHPAAAYRRAEKVVLLAEELLGFLFTSTAETIVPVFDTVTNHLPVLRIGIHRLVGPDDGMINISLGELIATDADMVLYTTTKDECHLDNLIARLYRHKGPMQPCGRKVEPFIVEQTQSRANLIRLLPAWKKQLILFWYSACIDNIQHGTFYINGREISFEPLFSSKDSQVDSLGWLSVQIDLAEKHIFGNMAQTSEANILDVLTLLLNYKFAADHVAKLEKGN